MLRALTSRFQLLRSSTFVNTLNLLLCKHSLQFLSCFNWKTHVFILTQMWQPSSAGCVPHSLPDLAEVVAGPAVHNRPHMGGLSPASRLRAPQSPGSSPAKSLE